MKAFLEHEDLWGCVMGEAPHITDQKKMTKARTKITLALEPINYIHVQDAVTPKEAWDKLEAAFDDSGLTKRVGLLRRLIGAKLENFQSTEEYVNEIITTAHNLSTMGFKLGEEWIEALLLAGLPEEYRPMIMGLESSGIGVTGDAIKAKLLQDVTIGKKKIMTDSDSALFVQKKDRSNIICYKCNKRSHFGSGCKNAGQGSWREKSESRGSKNQSENRDRTSNRNEKVNTSRSSNKCFFGFAAAHGIDKNSWYIDSGASNHMTTQKDWLINT